jgi:hypothetical protein
MTKDEAMKMALEALECLKRDFDADQFEWGIADEAITAIEEALAQPEQEPVAWEQFYPDIGKPKFVAQPEQEPLAWINDMGTHIDLNVSGRGIPLYTTPPQRKTFNHHEFGYWWFEYGSGLHPLKGEDQEEHAYRVAAAAWQAAHGIKE